MSIMNINMKVSGIDFNLSFADNLILFTGLSGEGKTFMFKCLKEYLNTTMGTNCVLFNSSAMQYPESAIKDICKGAKVVIFDNADLYLTQNVLDYAVSNVDIVIVSMKLYFTLNFNGFSMYTVDYKDKSLCVRKANTAA